MNEVFFENLDANFEQAYNMCNSSYTHDELLSMLRHGNIPQKQIAGLLFDYVKTEEDAKALLSNLTGCDGKIREACAFTINKIINNDKNTIPIFSAISAQIFADASIDINGNVCRLVIDSARNLQNDYIFSGAYTSKIVDFTHEALSELDKFIFRDKKYIINKQLFKLYWCLEALKYFHNYTREDTLHNILQKCVSLSEYTIREKVAEIITLTNVSDSVKEMLKKDDNYYVKEALNHHSFL